MTKVFVIYCNIINDDRRIMGHSNTRVYTQHCIKYIVLDNNDVCTDFYTARNKSPTKTLKPWHPPVRV